MENKWEKFLPAVVAVLALLVVSGFGPAVTENLLSLLLGVNVNQLNAAGSQSVRYLKPEMVRLDAFPWDVIEREQDQPYDYTMPDKAMNWARENGLSVLGIIQYAPGWANGHEFQTPVDNPSCGLPSANPSVGIHNHLRVYPPLNNNHFANFAYNLAHHYPDVMYWQIWNEPNSATFWPSGPNALEYAKMLEAVYPSIKRANPQAQVVLGGIALNDIKYIDELYAAGARKYFDKLAVHLYNPRQSPKSYLATELERLHSLMAARGDRDKEIWLTEIGWYTGASANKVSERRQADYIEQTYQIAKSLPYVGAVFWHTLTDCPGRGYSAANPEHNYGLFKGDARPKQAAIIMKGILLNK